MRNSMVKGLMGLVAAAVLGAGGLMVSYGAGAAGLPMNWRDGQEGPVYQVESRLENDRQLLSAASQCFRSGETKGEFWVTGRDYMPEGSILKVFYGDSIEYSSSLEDEWETDDGRWQRVRFSVEWRDLPGSGGIQGEEDDDRKDDSLQEAPEERYWQLGDTVAREIGEKTYLFRCIDQNYQSVSEAGETAALFLCDSVIPADAQVRYAYEKQEDGSYAYVCYPGPIADFGDTGSYKLSRVRQWLDSVADESWGALQVELGVNNSYTGQTKKGMFEQLEKADLRPQAMAYQKLTGQLFVLSVEEALQYRQYLWRFGVSLEDAENPETQIGTFSQGYWLRTPYRENTPEEGKGPAVYVVDLVDGVIRPQQVSMKELSGGEESGEGAVQAMSIGVRPAFVLPQQG